MQALFSGGTPDVVPAGFWFHYNSRLTPKELADEHLKLYRTTDMDIVKVMQDYRYPELPPVQKPSDWYRIKMPGIHSPEFEKITEVVRRILDQTNGEVMVFQTMFGPFKAADIAYGDDVVMAHAKEDPKAVAAGVNAIAESLEEWAYGYLRSGADGIYYSAQFGEVGRFSYDEWAKLVMPSDRRILDAADHRRGKYNILHICGEPEYDFRVHLDRFGDYPCDLVNWSVKDNHYSLVRGREFFRKPVLGGMNNKGNLVTGTEEQIQNEIAGILREFGQNGLMIGADCTVQGNHISLEKIRTAVEFAHSYQFL